MKNLNELNKYRNSNAERKIYGINGDSENGLFDVPCPATAGTLSVIASCGAGWEHVSVSMNNRTPNWTEMDYIKRLFFRDDESAMQLHVPVNDHISRHPNCLHLWRPIEIDIPRPPSFMVA